MYQGYVRGTGNSAWAGSIARGLENRDLKWETTDTKNFGIDFGLFNNHLSGNVNYYYNETSDLLQSHSQRGQDAQHRYRDRTQLERPH